MKAHTFGQTGVLTGVQLARVRTQDGAEVTDSQTFSDVCVRREGRWYVVLAHSVPSVPEVRP